MAMKIAGFSSIRRGLRVSVLPRGERAPAEMESTPPAIAISVWPEAIWLDAMAMDCSPEEQKRLMVIPPVEIGSLDSTTAKRARLPSCSPVWLAAPTTTSSTSFGAMFGFLSSSESMQCASMSSDRVRLKLPRWDLANPCGRCLRLRRLVQPFDSPYKGWLVCNGPFIEPLAVEHSAIGHDVGVLCAL